MIKNAILLLSLAAMTASAEIVDFVGNVEPGELSNTANWSTATWSATATQRVNGASVAVPEGGFKLSAPLAAARQFRVQGFSSDAAFDVGAAENLNVNELYFNSNGKKSITFSGDVANLTYIYLGIDTTLALRNGLFHIATGNFYCYNWNSMIKILKDAELVVDSIGGDATSGSLSPNSGLRIDGGRLTINGYKDKNYGLVRFGHTQGGGLLEIVNGGVYYEGATPQLALAGPNTHGLIDNGGAYIATNATGTTRNIMMRMSSGTFAVTNGTFLAPQFYAGTYRGPYANNMGLYNDRSDPPTDSRFTFHNSRTSFQYWKGSYKGCFLFAGNAKGNTVRLDGDDNLFDTYYFLWGGVSNRFTVAGGSFAASQMRFLPGVDNIVEFTGGHSVITNLYGIDGAPVDSFTNIAIKVSGTAESVFPNGMNLYGTNTSLLVSGGLLDAGANLLKFCGPCATYEATGGSVTGCFQFASNGGTVRIAGNAEHVATYGSTLRNSSITFGENLADNVFVVSNATFTSRMPFLKSVLTTTEGPQQEGIPFTNCPNCRIEFQGESPKFLVTSNKRSASDGGPWYSFVVGNTYDPAPLKDALRLKFVLPENAYVSAPVQVTASTAVLGGNAEFEFDTAAFKWPALKTRIPLIYNASAFKGWNNRSYIDIDGLNATNAERLPVRGNGRRARFALSADGKTLELVMPDNGGFQIFVR